MKIVIPGGSGQVGTALAKAFHGEGHEVVVLARSPGNAPWRTVPWDGETLGPWASELDGADVVINLAGRSVNCRYTPANRAAILASRTRSTVVVGKAIALAARRPATWMQMSTATIYAHRFDAANDEATGIIGGHEPDAPDSWRFSIEVATAWERALADAAVPGTRTVAMRSVVILGPGRGGIFDTLLMLVRRGLGGTSGSGRQWVSWIHEEDFIRSISWLIEHREIDGVVNLASPAPVPNAEFMRELRRAWGARIGLPAPAWMLALGAIAMRTETELVLKSRRVVPGRMQRAGFTFNFPEWSAAAVDLCQRWRAARSDEAARAGAAP